MSRREIKNTTGFKNKEGINHRDAWISFPCLRCGKQVLIKIGQELPTTEQIMENAFWECPHCGYIHSCISDLPNNLSNFPKEWVLADDPHCKNFWLAFFRMTTKDTTAYWKQCSKCGRIMPISCFDAHKDTPGKNNWKPLNRQAECKACKAMINANLNKLRTNEQLFEGTIGRRVSELLSSTSEKVNIKEVFDKFGGKCFKTGVELDFNDRKSWHIDHILPSKYFYPLTIRNAALLSKKANEDKGGRWPSEFYTDKELVKLSKITGANLELISSKTPIYNKDIDPNKAVERLFSNVRENSHIPKLVEELKKVIVEHNLLDALSEENHYRLGIV